MQVCTSLQTDNHANTSPLSFLQAGCPSCRPTNSVKALKAVHQFNIKCDNINILQASGDKNPSQQSSVCLLKCTPINAFIDLCHARCMKVHSYTMLTQLCTSTMQQRWQTEHCKLSASGKWWLHWVWVNGMLLGNSYCLVRSWITHTSISYKSFQFQLQNQHSDT